MSKFAIFLIGYLIFTIGVAVAMNMVNVPPMWIGVTVLIMIGLGIIGGTQTKRDDPPPGVMPPPLS